MNDSQATAIGEYAYGGNHNPNGNLVVVNVKQGIGAGILINGRLFQGDGGGAGEIGHVVVQEKGEKCRCGKRGCLETLASAQAVVRHFQEQRGFKHPVTLADVRSAFEEGDEQTRQIVMEAGRVLGNTLGNLVGTLNIQKIVLTGDMTSFGSSWFGAVERAMRESTLNRMVEGTKLEVGGLDYRACILGASALLVLDDYSILLTGTAENA